MRTSGHGRTRVVTQPEARRGVPTQLGVVPEPLQRAIEGMNSARRLMTVEDVAELIGMSPGWVRAEARKGLIPGARKFGEGRSGRWRFQPEMIDQWLRGSRDEG